MIQKLTIQNFQAHQDSVLDFSPNLNVVSGSNDVGKTSIIRALNWIINNRPLGNGFIRKNQSNPAKVTLIIDSVIVEKERGKNTNTYTIYVEGKEPQTFTAFGSNPPEIIVEALNFSDINVQSQHELPFLVLDSPGQVALCIRNATKIDIIDNVISKIGSKIRECNFVIETKKEELESVEKELEILTQIDLEKFEESLILFKQLQREKEKVDSQKTSLRSTIEVVERIDQSIFMSFEELEKKILLFEQVQKKGEEIRLQLSSLKYIIDALEGVEKFLLICPENMIKRKISFFEDKENQYNILKNRINLLLNVTKQIDEIECKLLEMQNKEEVMKERNVKLYQELSQCPLCGQDLDEVIKSRMINTENIYIN